MLTSVYTDKGSVYFFMYQLFCHSLSSFIEFSFSDWKKANRKTNGHDSSTRHEQWLIMANKTQHIMLSTVFV